VPLHGHQSPRTRLAAVSEGVASGDAPACVLHFEEDDSFMFFDANVVVEEPDLYGLDDCVVICEDCLLEQHPGVTGGMALAQEWGEARFEGGVWFGVGREEGA
jgi:hypothetical protein